ncbi:MAG TPA: hypothetical protein DCP38_15900, partial [Acidobacteria bacterium]|nr:hypothetical protein [Acidobacteriota bacterium]
MTNLLRMMAFSLALPLLAVSPIAAQDRRPMEIEDLLTLASVSDPRISPDGRFVAYVVTTMDFEEDASDSELWVVATDGGAPVRLTQREGRDNGPRWSPNGDWLAFLSDRGDDDAVQVHGIRPDGGEAWAVTAWPTGIQSFRLSPDGERIAFVARPEKSEDQESFEEERGRPDVWGEFYQDEWSHLWVAPLADGRAGEAERHSPDGAFVTTVVWAPDSSRLAYAARPAPDLRTNREANVYVVDAADAAPRQVTDMPGGESPVAWTTARGLIVAGSGQALGTYNRRLFAVPDAGGALAPLTDGLDEHAGFVALTDDDLLYVEAAEGTGRSRFRIALPDGEPERVTDDTTFRRSFTTTDDGTIVAFLAESGTAPADVHVADVSGGSPRRLTDHNPQVSEFRLGEQRVV